MAKKVNAATLAEMYRRGTDTMLRELEQQVAAENGISMGKDNTRQNVQKLMSEVIAQQQASKTETPLTDTAVSKNPKVEVPLGSAYLMGNMPGVSSPYAAGILAQQKQQEMAQPAVSGNQTGRQQTLSDPYAAVSQAKKQLHSPEWEAEQARKAMEDYRKRQEQLKADEALRQKDMDEYATWSPEEQRMLERYILDRDAQRAGWVTDQFMTTPETSAKVLIDKYGLDRVKEMAESYTRTKNKEVSEDVAKKAQEGASKSGWAAAGHSVASVGANLLDAATGTMGYVNEMFDRTGRYSTLDPNNTGKMFSTYAGNVRGTVSGMIAGDEYDENGELVKEGGKLREGLSMAYQGGMSAADSAARILATGGSAGVSAALAASGAFSQTVQEASRQGATPGQAAALGVTKAGIEYMTEKLPTEKVLQLFKGANDVSKVAAVLQQAFLVEPTSEEVSLFAGVAAEAMILRDKSNQNLRIGEMVANGMNHEDAKKQFYTELWNEAAQTYVSSMFSGLLSSGGAAILGGNNNVATPEQMPAEAGSAALAVEPEQQAAPSAEQLLDGIQDMTPEPAPLTEAQQHFDNAAAIANGMEPDAQKNAVSEETALNVRSANTAITEENRAKKTLAYELATNLDSIRDMEPVSQLSGTEFKKTDDGKTISTKLREFFQSIGNKVVRHGFGDVELGEYGIGAFLTHKPINRARAVSMAAVPDVIKNGRQIGYDPDWKGRGYPSYIFAAPVKVAGTDVYVAAVVNQLPDNRFYLSEMVDSDGNYVRIEESPSGNSKNGLPMGPEVQQGRDYAGPEELSEGSNPPANAEPMPLPDTIVTDGGNEVKGNQGNFESPQTVDTQNQSPEGGQDAAGTVGAMQSQFRHDVKQSRVYGNTYKNTQYADIHDIGRAAKNADPNIDQYDVITEAESLHEAELRTQTGRDRLVEHNALMKKAGWTGADNDTAMKLLTAYRKEGKQDRFLELSRKQRQMATQGGQLVQSFAKYSREDATVAVQDAIADLDELTIDQVDKTFWKPKQEEKGEPGKQDAFQKWKESITGSLLEVANDIENVKDGDKDSMRDLVRQIANLRHTTAWMGYSSELTSRTERGLDKMDFDTLKAVAKTQLSMIPNDFRKRDAGEIMKQIRVQNMLFTLTTKLKNDSGNISNGLMDAVSDSLGGRMIDAILSKFTGQRTVGNDLKFAKEYSKAARDAADVAAAFVSLDIPMEMDTKYSSGRTRTWSPNTTNVLARMMSAFEKHMKYALEVSDKFYEGGAAHVVNRSLQDLGEKSNLTPEQIQDIAQKTGQRRTFKDPGASVSKDGQPKKGRMFARANVGLQRGLNQIGNENIGLGDLVMPFAAVSGEVKQVGMDYTGGGLISGLNEIISIAKDARNGKQIDPYRQRVAATDFGRGMTGVGLIIAFTGLAATGAIKVHNDRDSEERMMNQTQGLSGAQWNLNASLRWWEAITAGATAAEAAKASKWQSGDELITIDFLEPFNTQMHIGYLLSQGEDVLTAIAQGNFDSLLEMPMMQTLSDLADLQQAFTEVSDGDMGGVYDAAGQLVGTVAGSAVPNWARKTAQIIDPYYRNTYDTNPFKKAGKDVLAAVPFASRNLPKKYDNLGKEQRRYEDGGWMAAAFDNLVTPWDTDTYQTNDAYQEIQRLNAIEGVDVTPPAASRKITYTDKNGVDHKGYALTDAQYETMQKVQGQTAAKVIDGLISSKDYAALTDEQKAAAIKMAYSYAKETAEIAAVENHLGYSTSWMKGIKGGEAGAIIIKTTASSLDKAADGLMDDWGHGWEDVTNADALKWAYDTFSQLGKVTQANVENSLDGMTADYVEARGEGISHEAFLDAAKLLVGITPQAGKATPRDFQKAEAIAGMKGVSEADKTLLIKQQMSESQNENLDQMLDLGYSPEEYAGVLKIYREIYDSDSKTKKDDFLKKLMDRYGMTRAQANAVYQIYK